MSLKILCKTNMHFLKQIHTKSLKVHFFLLEKFFFKYVEQKNKKKGFISEKCYWKLF